MLRNGKHVPIPFCRHYCRRLFDGESESIETPDDGVDDSVEYAEHEVIAGELENEDDESPQ